ncbi:MAG: hypothetical protein J6Q10_00495 [Clostridia bacterium]|nr:hypothetical protein [Clostridia bacterium]
MPALNKTKKGEKEVNLKDFIIEWNIDEVNGKNIRLSAVFSAGGSANIKPDIVVAKLCEFLGFEEFAEVSIHRTGIFFNSGKEIEKFC